MVLLRGRRTKLLPASRTADSEDGSSAQRQAQVRARQEHRRRGALYDVSSATAKRLPSVSLQPVDARVRRDLFRLMQQQDKRKENEQKSVYEDEQNDCKHREHLNYRPPLDQIHPLRDLHTTVAKDCRDLMKLTAEQRVAAKIQQKLDSKQYGSLENAKPEWRLGYNNNIDMSFRAGVGGTFEPREGTRERILDSHSAPGLISGSVTVAYPLKNSDSPHGRVWQEHDGELNNSDVDNQLDGGNEKYAVDSQRRRRVAKKKPWCPASSSKSRNSSSPRRRYEVEHFTPPGYDNTVNSPYYEEGSGSMEFYDHDGLQRFPLRTVESFESIDETEAEIVVDVRCAERQQKLLTKAVDTYSRVRARIDRMKDPQLRYELPVENPVQHPRAYRLGLDDVPSTAPKKVTEKPKFRPKSAGTSVGFQINCLAPKAGDLLALEHNGVWKVGGAKRRPHSANITFFKHSTVYCMESPTPSKSGCISASTDFRSVVDVECRKRQRERDSVLQKLATRGLLHSTPLAQIFARLRREGLLNIDRRLQRSLFEKMTLDEYMNACGCLNTPGDPSPTDLDASPIKDIKRFCANENIAELATTSTVDASPSLKATRKALVVSRQQFHLALEAFNLSPTDVNLLFSALDLTVSDFVQVWDAICTVETLQHEHTALRRARVQQLQAPPAKDLEFFRRVNNA